MHPIDRSSRARRIVSRFIMATLHAPGIQVRVEARS